VLTLRRDLDNPEAGPFRIYLRQTVIPHC